MKALYRRKIEVLLIFQIFLKRRKLNLKFNKSVIAKNGYMPFMRGDNRLCNGKSQPVMLVLAVSGGVNAVKALWSGRCGRDQCGKSARTTARAAALEFHRPHL